MKIKVTSTIRRQRPDISRAVFRAARRLFRDALEEWLKVAISNVTIDTGMTASSFLRAAGEIRARQIIAQQIRGFGPVKPGHTNLYGAPVPTENIARFKSRALGEKLGAQAYNIDRGTQADPFMFFDFSIVVLQHYFNEFGIGSNKPSWDSLEKANAAFSNYVRENYESYLPDFRQWLINGRIVNAR